MQIGHFVACVARFTRAWIETYQRTPSALLRRVARFTRAWIETGGKRVYVACSDVARFTRAWIETAWAGFRSLALPRSPASRGRGLKLQFLSTLQAFHLVARFTRAWIETRKLDLVSIERKSPASRGRGLKPQAPPPDSIHGHGRPLHAGVD